MSGGAIYHTNSKKGVLTMRDLRQIVKTANEMRLHDDVFVFAEPELGMRVGWGYRRRRKSRKVREVVVSSQRRWYPPEPVDPASSGPVE